MRSSIVKLRKRKKYEHGTRKTIYCLVRIFACFEVYMHIRCSQSTMLVLITVGNENLLRWDVLKQRICIPNSVKKGKGNLIHKFVLQTGECTGLISTRCQGSIPRQSMLNVWWETCTVTGSLVFQYFSHSHHSWAFQTHPSPRSRDILLPELALHLTPHAALGWAQSDKVNLLRWKHALQ